MLSSPQLLVVIAIFLAATHGVMVQAKFPSLFDEEPGVTDVITGSNFVGVSDDAGNITSSSSTKKSGDVNHEHHHQEAACPVLLVYYDSNCGHCRSMAPKISVFAKRTFVRTSSHQRIRVGNAAAAASSVTKDITESDVMMSTLRIGAVNCAVHTKDCRLHKITGVPSFIFVSPATSSSSKEHATWKMLSPMSSADEIYTTMEKELSPVFATMTPAQRDVCSLKKNFLLKRKQKLIVALEKSKEGAGGLVAAHDGVASFTEERQVHAQDLIASLFHALFHEVPLVTLFPPAQKTLLRFLQLVNEFLPGLSLDPMLTLLSKGEGVVPPSEWHAAVIAARLPVLGLASWYDEVAALSTENAQGVKPLSLEDPPADAENAWRTCKGSSWKFRGYTCGLWLMYHTMVTAAAIPPGTAGRGAERGTSAFEAIQAIRAYVLTFFACEECRQHFATFRWWSPAEHPLGWDADLQLWAAHNQVNRRLGHVVDGQDPSVPKRQFPDIGLCTNCAATSAAATVAPDESDDQVVFVRAIAAVYDAAAVTEFMKKKSAPTAPPTSAAATVVAPDESDDQVVFVRATAAVYDAAAVTEFMRRWFRWNMSGAGPMNAKQGKDLSIVVAKNKGNSQATTAAPVAEVGESCGGDMCPFDPPTPTPVVKKSGGLAAEADKDHPGVWYTRTRHPSFIVRHDDVFMHSLKTIFALIFMFGVGYVFAKSAVRRHGGTPSSLGLHPPPAAVHHATGQSKSSTTTSGGLQWLRNVVGAQSSSVVSRRNGGGGASSII
ncbi:quiescin sulfhydryl oxidase, putative [Bodo saltans]|uniref:Sulfhydryl oxidase n=1 Tax=Bodo saltans TaxID=75058 RepID=A0A0S4ILW1_BODSA|nr:quiescin sulfhydryl oxidase, putative [Bodo saltans]|eukprot:CUE72262.1 quiescin sulfhydryl oxidase, putative [Bodo saltans]